MATYTASSRSAAASSRPRDRVVARARHGVAAWTSCAASSAASSSSRCRAGRSSSARADHLDQSGRRPANVSCQATIAGTVERLIAARRRRRRARATCTAGDGHGDVGPDQQDRTPGSVAGRRGSRRRTRPSSSAAGPRWPSRATGRRSAGACSRSPAAASMSWTTVQASGFQPLLTGAVARARRRRRTVGMPGLRHGDEVDRDGAALRRGPRTTGRARSPSSARSNATTRVLNITPPIGPSPRCRTSPCDDRAERPRGRRRPADAVGPRRPIDDVRTNGPVGAPCGAARWSA